uniref:HSPB1-associated protein 1 n=1 Tax=Ciona intestinalis TaxID=7719 RepID=UPI000180C0C1|nr:HSPB1-associated protein 1 [Ciona intestinalis]|eukprot:XP_002119759.1 HSPB1-associated protein 1 [Ciona intestinalis]
MASFNLKKYLSEQKLELPVVFRNVNQVFEWKVSSLDLNRLQGMIGDKKIKARVGQKQSENLQWEGECRYINITISDFIQLINSNNDQNSFNIDLNNEWVYADYIYVRDLFNEVQDFEVLDFIQWKDLGFSGTEGTDSAIWIGTQGAHTVCHYDTYGYNLVLQVQGRKRWMLFPPSDSQHLHPTRIPYEESSVFSKVDLQHPDLEEHESFTSCHPHVITLEPGDMLYVPQQWWHYVENLETSISVNAWFPSDEDDLTRVKEAASKLIVKSASHSCSHFSSHSCSSNPSHPPPPSSWFNPSETTLSIQEDLEFLQLAVEHYKKKQRKHKPKTTEKNDKKNLENPKRHNQFKSDDQKTQKNPVKSDNFECVASKTSEKPENCHNCEPPAHYNVCSHTVSEGVEIIPVKELTFEECVEKFGIWENILGREKSTKKFKRSFEKISFQDFVECLSTPKVVDSLVGELLKRGPKE